VEIRPLGPGLVEDYLAYFERDAFGGNPDWVGCYCLEAHSTLSEAEWDAQPHAERRAEITALIAAGRHHGLLAYAHGRPIGWVQAGPLATLENPDLRAGREEAEVAGVGSITCFNVAAAWRGRGLTGTLLEAACARLAEQGLSVAEGYPWRSDSPRGSHRNYHGPLRLWLEHGFAASGEVGDTVIVRRTLSRKA